MLEFLAKLVMGILVLDLLAALALICSVVVMPDADKASVDESWRMTSASSSCVSGL